MIEVNMKAKEPLASRMRPTNLDSFIGQSHILGENTLLRRAIKADQLSSMILYGPPGTGKTSLATVIANTTNAEFCQLNATISNKKEMEEVVKHAQLREKEENKQTILFIDEIHRFNKAQQDFLLPFVEKGTIILIGATTENPYFEVNKALISRSHIFELKPLTANDIKDLLRIAITDTDRGYGSLNINISDTAISFLSEMSAGDVRHAYNSLELAVTTTDPDENDVINIDLETAQECIQKKILNYDKDGDMHYDTISAFIKSMRGSDPDGVLYYLARLLDSGEDVKFIARRIMIHAAEDVGLADPMALVVATSASQAVERIGMPEGRIILAEAALYVARAPKSNSCCTSIDNALKLTSFAGDLPIPSYLQDAHYKSAGKLGRGIGYLYPHDYPGGYVEQQYLPDKIKDVTIYKRKPTDDDYFKTIHGQNSNSKIMKNT